MVLNKFQLVYIHTQYLQAYYSLRSLRKILKIVILITLHKLSILSLPVFFALACHFFLVVAKLTFIMLSISIFVQKIRALYQR